MAPICKWPYSSQNLELFSKIGSPRRQIRKSSESMKQISFETLKGLNSQGVDPNLRGLTPSEVTTQRARYGTNKVVEVPGNLWLEIARDTLKDPMIWFLIGIGLVFLFIGNIGDAVILFSAIFPLVFMDAILHWRTQASTSSLKEQLATEVIVIRSPNTELKIDACDLVAGDLIKVFPGLFLPADGIFQVTQNLQIDESILTGEAFPIQKQATALNPFKIIEPGEISVNPNTLGLAGTKVLSGQGLLRVLQIGQKTAYGEIVQSVFSIQNERTPLQIAMTKMVQGLLYGGGVFCLLLAAVRIYQGHGWLDALLSAATLAVAAIPEEFPVVFTFFLGIGIYRLARQKALVRRAVSVENIGRITTICTDKTGTITRGRLELTHLEAFDGLTNHDVLSISLAASNPLALDPIDLAIQEVSQKEGISFEERFRVFPFNENTKRETAFIKTKDGKIFASIKGAPEGLLTQSTLSHDDRKIWLEKTAQWAREGHKVIACARKFLTDLEIQKDLEPSTDLEFCGLLAFEDPPRPEVASAIEYCNSQGIHVLMMTGDHPLTAMAVAQEVGLGGKQPVMVCAEEFPQKFEEAWLRDNPNFLTTLDIVARCTPLQKLNLVRALKTAGKLVAVTGDGVNDVPALKTADIGIAMGERGSRSAKEVSSIVLMDDNFQTITNAIKEGRQLFLNLKVSFEYLLLIHIPFVLTAALIPLLGFPLLYLPVHIVWLELIIHPTALFAFQGKLSSKATPQASGQAFFSSTDIFQILSAGISVALAMGFLFHTGLSESSELGHARSLALSLLVFWSAALVGVFTRLKTWPALIVFICSILSALILIEVPSLAKPLGLSPLHLTDWLTVGGVAVICSLLVVLVKRVLRYTSCSFRCGS